MQALISTVERLDTLTLSGRVAAVTGSVMVGTADAAPKGNLVAITLATGAITELPLPGRVAIGMVDDHLVYLGLGGDITAARFDTASLKVLGDPVTLVGSVGAAGLSPQGTLAYIAGNASSRLVLASGTSRTPIRPDSAIHSDPRFSPDGKSIAFSAHYDGNVDAYVVPADGGPTRRLTWHPAVDRVLAPYGARGAYGRSNHPSHRRVDDEIRVLRQGQAILATQPVPPGMVGAPGVMDMMSTTNVMPVLGGMDSPAPLAP